MLGRLSELLFVEVVRRYAESLDAGRTDWLSGLRDPNLSLAITALHREPQRDWTVQSLARAAGTFALSSGGAFHAVRRRAADAISRELADATRSQRVALSTDSVATIANRVGYESEAAFSRAFTKSMGEPPSSWRKRQWRTA